MVGFSTITTKVGWMGIWYAQTKRGTKHYYNL